MSAARLYVIADALNDAGLPGMGADVRDVAAELGRLGREIDRLTAERDEARNQRDQARAERDAALREYEELEVETVPCGCGHGDHQDTNEACNRTKAGVELDRNRRLARGAS